MTLSDLAGGLAVPCVKWDGMQTHISRFLTWLGILQSHLLNEMRKTREGRGTRGGKGGGGWGTPPLALGRLHLYRHPPFSTISNPLPPFFNLQLQLEACRKRTGSPAT